MKKHFKEFEWCAEDIQLSTKGYYNIIRTGSIAWYIVRTVQVLFLFLAAMMPYLTALVIAGCLGF